MDFIHIFGTPAAHKKPTHNIDQNVGCNFFFFLSSLSHSLGLSLCVGSVEFVDGVFCILYFKKFHENRENIRKLQYARMIEGKSTLIVID